MSIADQIKGYFHRVEDIDYINGILSKVSRPQLFEALIQLIQSASADDIAKADLFLRDTVYQANIDNTEFKTQLVTARVPAAYVQNLFARNHYVRRIALGTLTTFGDWWTPKEIEAALAFFESNDPLLLPGLVKHMMFQSRWANWSVPQRLITSHEFIVRWSMLEVLAHVVTFPLPQPEILSGVTGCLEKLRNDPNEAVRAETAYLWLEIENYGKMAQLPKLEKRQLSKTINKAVPKARFENFRMFVERELHKDDFTMPELNELAEVFQRSN